MSEFRTVWYTLRTTINRFTLAKEPRNLFVRVRKLRPLFLNNNYSTQKMNRIYAPIKLPANELMASANERSSSFTTLYNNHLYSPIR